MVKSICSSLPLSSCCPPVMFRSFREFRSVSTVIYAAPRRAPDIGVVGVRSFAAKSPAILGAIVLKQARQMRLRQTSVDEVKRG